MHTPSVEATFQRGAKSFSLAALFFSPEMYRSAAEVYAWCRYCDDAVDGQAHLGREELEKCVSELREKTLSVFRGEPQVEAPFLAFQRVAQRYGIPAQYPLDLLEGMAMDARRERFATLADLELYAYRVAGTVGLMMTYVLGAKNPEALQPAKQLGIAMQLTNISRDILEDASLGRVYLPLTWLAERGLTFENFTRPENRRELALLADRLVSAAEPYYSEGLSGLRLLPFRAAIGIAAAARIYRAIGLRVRARGERAWNSRTVVPFLVKAWHMLLSPWRTWRLT